MGRKGWAATIAAALAFVSMAPLAAQETVGKPPAPEPGWTVPKTQWGDPDLRGTYPLDAVGALRCNAGRNTATGC